MKKFKKMLEEDDVFSLKYLNEQDSKYDQECKNIILYIKKQKKIDAEGFLKEFSKDTAIRYIQLCNSHAKEKESMERSRYCEKLRGRLNIDIELDEKKVDLKIIIDDCDSIEKLNKWLNYFLDKPWFVEDLRKELSKQVYKKLGGKYVF